MSCPTVTTIQKTECIGNSLVTINSNFDTIAAAVCDNWAAIQAIQAQLAQQIMTVGMIAYFPATSPPAGWLDLNGSLISRETYANLWNYASSTTLSGTLLVTDSNWLAAKAYGYFSSGNGSTTFRLPNLRGYFLRSAGTSTDGTAAGQIGVAQASQNLSHNHSATGTVNINTWNTGLTYGEGSAGVSGTGSTGVAVTVYNSGGTEARPNNIALLPCIKY